MPEEVDPIQEGLASENAGEDDHGLAEESEPSAYQEIQEEYQDQFQAQSMESERMFATSMQEFLDSNLLMQYISHIGKSSNTDVKNFVTYYQGLNQEQRIQITKEVARLKFGKIIPKNRLVPFCYKSQKKDCHENEKTTLYLTRRQPSNLFNLLNIVDFSDSIGEKWHDIYKSRKNLFYNGGININDFLMSRPNDWISVKKWKRKIMGQFKETLEEKRSLVKDGIGEIANSMFLPREVLDNKSPQKILIALNTCSYSQKNVELDDTGQRLSYENYALVHMKAIAEVLPEGSEISLGYVEGKRYGFLSRLLNIENYTNYIYQYNHFADLKNGIDSFPGSVKGKGSGEAIHPLYNKTRSKNMDFDYVLFFTDGYSKAYARERASLASNPRTKFLIKGMHPSNGRFDSYVRKVPRSKDIVLNRKYMSPRYKEYSDRLGALQVFDRMIEKVNRLEDGTLDIDSI